MKIIIDSREQKPYRFENDAVIGTLATGDYSICGLEDCISIERKTVDDLVGCLSKERDRFERELQRGKGLDYFALVVEASLQDIAKEKRKASIHIFFQKPAGTCTSILLNLLKPAIIQRYRLFLGI